MVQPSAAWYWRYDAESKSLRINMPDFEFICACKDRALLPFTRQIEQQYFDVDDTELYTEFYTALEAELELTEEKLFQLSLNATAIRQFCADSSPKSWFFTPQVEPADASANILTMRSGENTGVFLRLNDLDNCVTVMLISETLELVTGKTMRQFEFIKVMQDRICAYSPANGSVFFKQWA